MKAKLNVFVLVITMLLTANVTIASNAYLTKKNNFAFAVKHLRNMAPSSENKKLNRKLMKNRNKRADISHEKRSRSYLNLKFSHKKRYNR